VTGKRPFCVQCLRPMRTCICALAVELNNRVELCIVQHPEEANNAKNTAGLLLASLKNNQKITGEVFDQTYLHAQLFAAGKQPLLLYPPTPDEKSLGLQSPSPLPDLTTIPAEQLRLVLLDATWRKSRKMLYLNPMLQALPRFSLHNPPPGIYKIRKADSENQLSTLEASCYALEQLEPGSHYQQLIAAFRCFVDQLASYNPAYSPP